jgi:hypothetical protein
MSRADLGAAAFATGLAAQLALGAVARHKSA